MVKLAQACDLPAVLDLVRRRDYPESRIPGVTGELRRDTVLKELEQHWETFTQRADLAVLRTTNAFWVVAHGQIDFSSGQPETVVVEHAGEVREYPQLLEESIRRAVQHHDEFLAVRVYPQEAERFAGLGLSSELRRVVRTIAPTKPQGPYRIREATLRDRSFLARLHVQSRGFYRSAGRRGVDGSTWEDMGHYLSLELAPESDLYGWVALEDDLPVGYVLIRTPFFVELYGDNAAYLYDIAVARECWGREAASQLHEHAVARLAERGVGVLVGDISSANERAFSISGRLGYELEWERWGRNL